MKRGIYAGSFDPPTRGHLDVMRRASLIVDELHVMIGVNPKKSGGFFPVAKRLELIEGSLAHMEWFGRDRSAFHIGQFAGLLVDYCRHTIRELACYRSPAVAKYVTPCVASALLDAN